MEIKDFLFVISLAGIVQGILITAMILVRAGKQPNKEWLLSGLFFASIVIMILVTMVNSSFYLITFIGLQRSSLWPKRAKHRKKVRAFDLQNRKLQQQALEVLMQKEERYRDPLLNRNKLALALDS